LVFGTNNIQDPIEKLNTAINILTRSVEKDTLTSHIDEACLNKVVVNEFSKSYLTKEVDKENKEGFFEVYNRLVLRLKAMILLVDKEYLYASSLASTVLEGALHQHFLKEHFPSLTECDNEITPTQYFTHLVNTILNTNKNV
jgi:hypothetical protein